MVHLKGRGRDEGRKKMEERPLLKLSLQNAAEVWLGGQTPIPGRELRPPAYLSAHQVTFVCPFGEQDPTSTCSVLQDPGRITLGGPCGAGAA